MLWEGRLRYRALSSHIHIGIVVLRPCKKGILEAILRRILMFMRATIAMRDSRAIYRMDVGFDDGAC